MERGRRRAFEAAAGGRRAALARSLVALALGLAGAASAADPVRVLFVGNSYTFGRADPVMRYGAATVDDLTAGFYAVEKRGTNPWEPHPWGGVPAVFKALTVEAGLDYAVSLSARNGASLRLHFLNAANPVWDLRGNVASQRWDVVVLQEQSDGPLPPGRGRHANRAQFAAYARRFERFIHRGEAETYTENDLYGGPAGCAATGLPAAECATVRAIPANPNASPATQVWLTETWARPDLVFAHRRTRPDAASPAGTPVVDPRGGAAPLFYPSLAAMTADLRAAFRDVAAAGPGFAGVIPVGDAFQAACDQGLVRADNFYDADGVLARPRPGDPPDLWWDDRLHASRHGSYLDALVQFGVLTGRDPAAFGAGDSVARDLGIDAADAVRLQRVASERLGAGAPKR